MSHFRTSHQGRRVDQLMLEGPYQRRRRTLQERLRRLGIRGWLWILAAVVAGVVVALYFG
jgi:hypothetical protein